MAEVVKELPAELRRFNWGAFFLTWIWGIGNRTWIALLAIVSNFFMIIPIIGALVPLGFSIWLGIKGNELAWNNKEWQSIEHFNRVQKNWVVASLIIFVLCIITSIILSGFVAGFVQGFNGASVNNGF